VIVTSLAIVLAGITGVHAVEENDDAVIISDGPIIPVAPGQIDSSVKGAEKFMRRGKFKEFNARHNNRWRASLNKKDGKVRILYGNLSRRYAGDPKSVARGFLKDAHAALGMKPDLGDLETLRVGQTPERYHVKLQQTYEDVPVRGALVLVHANKDGQVSMVQNDYRETLQVANQRRITQAAAVRIALDALEAEVGPAAFIAAETAREVVVPDGTRHLFVWEVRVPTENPFGYWVYQIDSESAAIIYKANEIVALKDGEGKAYKNNTAWHNENIKGASLRHMYTNAEGVTKGWLYGRHADIYDYNGNDPFSPNLKFKYDPNLPEEKPWFDATAAYYQLNTMRKWWQSLDYRQLWVPWFPDARGFYNLPRAAIVNVDDLCNAFYTPELAEGVPGFVFGNEGACAATSEDLVLDQSVVAHEYTHAVMDWLGFDVQFGGPVDNYGRAMGEGNADWFAHLVTKSPLSGDVAWAWSADGYLRRLDNIRVYPGDVDDPSLGVPEEHYTGEIWGGYLYDLSQTLKSKAKKFVYRGLFYFTAHGGHRLTQPDFMDAIYAQILAEQDMNRRIGTSSKNAAKAWGCMASRGINAVLRPPYAHASDYFGSGLPGSDQVAYYSWNFPQVKKIKTKGKILKASGTNEYPITVTKAGRTLKVKVKAKAENMDPVVEIYTTDSAFVAAGTSTADTALLEFPDIAPNEYVVVLSANNGGYQITIKVE
jgi:hypothetical protein